MKKIFLIVLISLMAGTFPAPASEIPEDFLKTDDPALQKALSRTFTLSFRGAEAGEALLDLAEMSGIPIEVAEENGAEEAMRKPLDFKVRDASLRDILWFLAENSRLDIRWAAQAAPGGAPRIEVTVRDPAMKKEKRQLAWGVGVLVLLVVLMVWTVARKRKLFSERDRTLETINVLPEEELIHMMNEEKKSDFIFQVLVLDRIGGSPSVAARNALVDTLQSPDPLIRKIAFSKLKKKHGIESLVADIEKVTEEEVQRVRKAVLKDIMPQDRA